MTNALNREANKLSVVIPTFNAADELRLTLQALVSGRDAAAIAEIVVVDGGGSVANFSDD